MEQIECKESSNVGWARYDSATQTLEIDFRSKGVKSSTYRYAGFPPEKWAEFCASESKGRWFAMHIRPNFQGERIA